MNKYPSGTYIVSDPCYLIENDEWGNLLDKYNYFEGREHCEDHGFQWFCHHTMWGDGGYDLKKNHKLIGEISVDAGLIAIIPVDLVEKWTKTEKQQAELTRMLGRHIQKIEISKDFRPFYADGVYIFGEYEVDTN